MAIDSVADMRVHPMLDPETAVVELAINGRALATGRPYNQRYVIFIEAKGGKIRRYREYWNSQISTEAFGGVDPWQSKTESAKAT
jgi:ketosteroid isomerase-like protein